MAGLFNACNEGKMVPAGGGADPQGCGKWISWPVRIRGQYVKGKLVGRLLSGWEYHALMDGQVFIYVQVNVYTTDH